MEITTVVLIVIIAARGPIPAGPDVAGAIALMLIGVAHTETARRAEHGQVRTKLPHYVDLTSVWIFAGAVALPPVLVAPVAAVICTHLWWRVGRPRVPYYRHLYSMTTMVLAALGGSAVLASAQGLVVPGGGIVGVVLGIVAFTAINTGLVAVAIAFSAPQLSWSTLFGDLDDNVLEVATLCIGVMTVVGFRVHPALVLFVVPTLYALHRAVLVKQLRGAASRDGKTGLLTAAAWHQRAEAALADRRRPVAHGLLILDLDHFKRINDTHGHLVGDDVLAAVAGAVSGETGDRDLAGRFGGEEFVVLIALPAPEGDGELQRVAERIRGAVAALSIEVSTPDGPLTVAGVTVSIGTALAEVADPADLRQLLQTADAALYVAKRSGRNRVRSGVVTIPAPRVAEPGLSTT